MMKVLDKIRRKLIKLRFQPIRVFCIHQVTDTFDADSMWPCDWIQTDVFKQKVTDLKKHYTFISLLEAQEHLRNDRFRRRKYAVLTADDGFASMKEVVSWLVEQQIPITLFINPIVWDGKTIGQNLMKLPVYTKNVGAQELYLHLEDLQTMQSPLVTLGYHGYEHIDEHKETNETFIVNFEKAKSAMACLNNVIPFYAHTYGRATEENDAYLRSQGITLVYVNGSKNYNHWQYLYRELLTRETMI